MGTGPTQAFMDQLDNTPTTAIMALGTQRLEDGNEYTYVQNGSTDTTCVDQQAVRFMAAGDFTVEPTTAATDGIAGIVQTAIDPEAYGWLQTGGFADATCTGSVTQGITLTANDANGVLKASSAAADFIVGYAVADSTSDVVKVKLTL